MGPQTEEAMTVQEAFAVRHRRAVVMWLLWAVLFLGFGWLNDFRSEPFEGPLHYAVLGAAVALILFHLWNWRCPSCQRYLGNWLFPRLCGRCGVPLR